MRAGGPLRATVLKELAEALRDLHRRLVERARRDEERQRGVVVGVQESLRLLTSDARFAWLHALSELIVDLEVFLKMDPAPSEDQAAAVRAEVERLITVPRFPETASAFTQRYCQYLAQDNQVAAAHAIVRQLAERLPEAASVDEAQVLHERHSWAEARRHGRLRIT